MSQKLADKRSFLIAHSNGIISQAVADRIKAHVSSAQIYFANDGMDATMKVNTSHPNIIIVERFLPKLDAIKLIHWGLETKSLRSLAYIILSEIPNEQQFVDEVVLGGVQFLEDWSNDVKLAQSLSRALNYITHKGRSRPEVGGD